MPEHRVTRHFVNVGDRQVHYRSVGEGPAVLLVHETPMTGVMLLPLAHKLANLGMTAIALDTPGYGISDRLPQPQWPDYPMIEDYADALVETIPALGMEKAHIYGSHTGALIVLEAGVRHPNGVGGVVVDGIPIFDKAMNMALVNPQNIPTYPRQQNGTHLLQLWHRYRDHILFWPWWNLRSDATLPFPLPTAEWLQDRWLDWILPGDLYAHSYHGAFRYEVAPALAATRARTVLSAHDGDFLKWGMESLPKSQLKRVDYARMSHEQHAPWLVKWLGKAPLPAAPEAPEPTPLPGRISRTYASDGSRQLLVRRQADAAVASQRPLVLVPDAPDTGSGLLPLLKELARTRPVHAIDAAGNGGSDPLSKQAPAVADYVASYVKAIRSLGLKQIDLYGRGTGAVIALELALAMPRAVGKLVLDAYPLDAPDARKALLKHPHISLEPELDGTHLQRAWTMVRDHEIHHPWFDRVPASRRHNDMPSADELHRRVLEVLKSPTSYDVAPRATWAHPLEQRLPLAGAALPTLVVAAERDVVAPRLKEIAALAGATPALLPADPAAAAQVIAAFLDGSSADAAKVARRLAPAKRSRRHWTLP